MRVTFIFPRKGGSTGKQRFKVLPNGEAKVLGKLGLGPRTWEIRLGLEGLFSWEEGKKKVEEADGKCGLSVPHRGWDERDSAGLGNLED